MSISEAIRKRKSIRAFKPAPVPRPVLTEMMETALRAPSWSNTQTWEVAVLGGAFFEQVKTMLSTKFLAGEKGRVDVPFPVWARKFLDRRDENGTRLYNLLGIGLEEREKQRQWYAKMHRFYDAPNGIIVYTERGIDPWALLNIGLLTQNIALAAVDHGLGTCIIAAGVSHADELRRMMNVPVAKQLVVALAIGYPDEEAIANTFISHREPLDSLVTFYGF